MRSAGELAHTAAQQEAATLFNCDMCVFITDSIAAEPSHFVTRSQLTLRTQQQQQQVATGHMWSTRCVPIPTVHVVAETHG